MVLTRKRTHRRDLRVAVNFSVKGKVKGSDEELDCLARDLSSGGMLLTCDKALLLGSMLTLEFMMPDSKHLIHITGLVARVRPMPGFLDNPKYLIALSFVQISAAMARHLRQLVTISIMALVEKIRDFPVFAPLTEFDLLALAGICHGVELAAGDVVIHAGDEATSLYVVTSGLVKMTGRPEEDGPDIVEVAACGQIFGEVSALTGLPHDLDVTALEPTELIGITREGFDFLREQHPETALRLLEVFHRFTGMRLRRLTRKFYSPVPSK